MPLQSMIISNNDRLSEHALNITEKYGFLCLSHDGVKTYLSSRSLPSSTTMNDLAKSSGVGINLLRSLKSAGVAVATVTGIDLTSRLIERVLWIKYLCNMLNPPNSERGKKLDDLFIGIALSIFLSLVLIIFGPSFVSVVTGAIKIHRASQVIWACNRENKQLQLLESINANNLQPLQRAAIRTSIEANKQMKNTYIKYRATRIAFLLTSLIVCIALFALAAGVILAFCSSATSAAITSAIIGCGVSGGCLLLFGCLGFIAASVYEHRKQSQATVTLQQAILCTMVSDQIVKKPGDYQRSVISQEIANTCYRAP
ncbi:inclusion membrane protein GarD [Chlamydia gallinacea]|uniref:Uncharacterized protein n=2 Tax=Chlamydia gallinacea TaxID=1457153 RepID=A0A173E032_9CHLA|nr:hypothetical protein [Chlamydia gallinacea]ANG66554.1 hypothetical protein M787_004440 [Chlamydia gallinacea 08-1274/3]MBX6680204.1 hypothetical protein [Chlamydia gallinacea]